MILCLGVGSSTLHGMILLTNSPYFLHPSSLAYEQFLLFAGVQWNPLLSLRAFSGNPLLQTTAKITLLYYTSVWAVVSTLMVYVARQFHFNLVKVRPLDVALFDEKSVIWQQEAGSQCKHSLLCSINFPFSDGSDGASWPRSMYPEGK